MEVSHFTLQFCRGRQRNVPRLFCRRRRRSGLLKLPNHFLRRRDEDVKRCNIHNENKFVFTQEIEIAKNGEGLLALKHFFIYVNTVKEPNCSSETLLRLAELVLTLNCFSSADSYYKQISGVAMGSKMGPSNVNLFVGYIEH